MTSQMYISNALLATYRSWAEASTDLTKAFIGLTYLRFEDGTAWEGLRLKIAAKAP